MNLPTKPKTSTVDRELAPDEIELINEIRDHGRHLGALVAHLRNNVNVHLVDQRWVGIGETDLQTGLMALIRAIEQPMGF